LVRVIEGKSLSIAKQYKNRKAFFIQRVLNNGPKVHNEAYNRA